MNGAEEAVQGLTPPWFDEILEWISLFIEAAGVATIVVGAVVATAVFVLQLSRGEWWQDVYHLYRTSLARAILLGLEFLVASDIVGTVAVKPTLNSLYVLGLIVLIRTFLSFSLETEIEGRPPWRRILKKEGRDGGQDEHGEASP